MRRNDLIPFLTGAVLLLTAAAVRADGLIDNFGDWSAMTASDEGGKFCYMASAPTKEEGDYAKRGDAFITVTHRPAEKVTGEVNIAQGYKLKEGSEVRVLIGGTTYVLFTQGDRAWTRGKDDDRALVDGMKRGIDLVVKGVSWRGTLTTDTYSLKGFTAAYNAISKACNL